MKLIVGIFLFFIILMFISVSVALGVEIGMETFFKHYKNNESSGHKK